MQRTNRDLLLLILHNQLALANYIQCRDGASPFDIVLEAQKSLLKVLDDSLTIWTEENKGANDESQLA